MALVSSLLSKNILGCLGTLYLARSLCQMRENRRSLHFASPRSK
jgi:hypothetical protein